MVLDSILVENILYKTVAKSVIIFGTDMNSSVHIDNKAKEILILGKRQTKGLNHMLIA